MRMPTGTTPKPNAARIVKVQLLDHVGEPADPPEFEFWVVSSGHPPTVLSDGHPTFSAAMQWMKDNKLVFAP